MGLSKLLKAGGGLAIAAVTFVLYEKSGAPLNAKTVCGSQYKFPAGANYPEISGYNNYMAQVLSPELYSRLRDLKTQGGWTLDACIQPGVDYPGKIDFKSMGCVAGDEASYEVFAEFFDKIIDERHEGYKPWDKHTTDLDFTKLKGGCLDDRYVLSTRMRTSRSIRGLGLTPACTRAERREIEKVLVGALTNLQGEFKGRYYPLRKMSPEEQSKQVEEGFMFPKPSSVEFLAAGMTNDWPDARGMWQNDSKTFIVWINERDHARLISMQKGGNIDQTFRRYCKGADLLEQEITKKGWDFMYNDHLGYIATSPADLGTGLRASVHIKLPQLSKDPRFDAILQDMKLQKRSVNGGDSPIVGDVFDISNSQRLGKSEVQLVQLLIDEVGTLIKMEKTLAKGGHLDTSNYPSAHSKKQKQH